MNITISKAVPSDLETILKLNKELFEYESQFTTTYNLSWTYSPTGREYFTKRLSQEAAICLLAKDNNSPIGYLLAYAGNYPYRSSNPILEIENMYVTPTYRQHGVGTALMTEIKDLARHNGIKRLRVEAIAQNEQAILFYRKMGFTDFNLILETML